MAAGLCWWVGPKTVTVAVVAAVSGNGRLFFHPSNSTWLGFCLNVGPGSAGLGPITTLKKSNNTKKEDLRLVLELF